MIFAYCILFVLVSYSYGQSLTSSASVVKRPGESVTLSCTVSGFSMNNYYMFWIRQKPGQGLEWIGYIDDDTNTYFAQSLQGQFSISKDNNENMLNLEVKSLKAEDTTVYFCARGYYSSDYGLNYFDYWGKGTSVTVTSATQQAPQSLFPVWQCGSSPDGFVTLGCVTRDLISADGLRFAWKDASGRALTNFVQYPAVIASGKYSSVSQARVSASDWDANKKFTCEVSNALGTKRADVQKPVVIVTAPSISISTSVNTTSNDINLICWLDGYHPKTINVDWGAGKRAIEKKFKNEEKKEFAMLSQISINTQQWNEGKEFTCSATHKTKTYSQTWSICKDHPNSEPRIQLEKPPLRAILTDTHVTTSCIVETVLQPTVSWLVNGYKKTGSGINSERQDESTVSNLTISVEDWTKSRTITCRAEHPCFKIAERTITIPETVQKPPTVVIRRSVADIGKRDSAVLECAASGLPSGELSVTFQANDVNFPEAQYVNLPEGQDTLVALFTIPGTHRTKSYRFTCEIQLSRSMKWKSDSIGKLFDDPSSELSVLSNEDKSASTTQKLLCYGTGLNPEIKWLPESVGNAKSEITMNSDGHVKVSSELSVPKQEWKRGTTFTCQVRDQGGLKTVQKSTSVCEVTPDHARSAQVYLFGPSISDRPEADPVLVTCLLLGYGLQDFSVNCKVGTAKVSSSVSKTENNINGTENVQWVLRVPAQRWKNYEKVSCEVKHPCSNAQTYTTSKTKDLAATLLLTSPTQTELDSGTATFICLASDFFPESHTFKWTHGMTNLDKKVKRTILSKENDTFTAMSILELTANEWIGSSSPVKCEFQHTAQNLSKEASYVSVDQQLPKVTIIPPSNEDILINRTGGLMCKAEGPEGFTGIKWFVNGKETASLPKEDVSRMTEITLTTSISYEEWTSGTKFTCEVYHSAFAQGFIKEDYRRQHGDRKCPEVYLLAPSESSGGNSVTLTCYVKEFYPQEVAVSWLVDDKQVDDVVSFKQNTTNVIERDNHFSAYSQLIVNPADWTSGSVFTCNVYHESIADPVRHISRSIAISSNPPTLVNLSLNVPQSCAPPVLY